MRLLILQPDLVDYRVETYNIINKYYELDVAYAFKDKTKSPCEFNRFKLRYRKIGPFFIVENFKQLVNNYSVVIIMADLHYPQYCLLPFYINRVRVISWGIGFRVSYIHPFVTNRKHTLLDGINQIVLAKCNANIFYMNKAKEFWKGTTLNQKQIFVAPNTTSVAPILIKEEFKKNFLFVGSLYKGKGCDLLISTFARLMKDLESDSRLIIVGDGEERQALEQYSLENGVADKVVFKGAIYDENELAKEFQNAILCISPTQGGLSVPKSMGYGVPFVVRSDAITGGEIYHIQNGVNGIVYNNDNELYSIMMDAVINPHRYYEMGLLAKDYYDCSATPYHMAKGALDAIEYALTQ